MMSCEERIRELEEQLRELKNAWEAEVAKWEERVRYLEEDCHELSIERDEWYDQAEEWKQRAYDYETERDSALEELNRIKPLYEITQTILQEELVHLETLVLHADWERAAEQIAHIRRRYHAAIAMHTLQNPNAT